MADDAFLDFCHLHPAGAGAFSARFGREALRPLLEGGPAFRYPALPGT
jgi:hypothetical protein